MTRLNVADGHDVMRLYAVAHRAKLVFPGSVGEMLSREILSWREFGYRFGGTSLMMRLITDIESVSLPQAEVSYPDKLAYDDPPF